MRPFRFGVVVTGATGGREWTEYARRVEDIGCSTLLVADHFTNPMACTPLLMAAAAATTTLRVGSYVYDNDFRHPAMLAKEAATIDVLSEGRFELGMGAGWERNEYVLAGLHFDEPGVRFRRLVESVGIVRALLAGEQVEHRGEHYRLRGLTGSPLPVQRPLPLLIGAGGRRMIQFAGAAADIVGIVPSALRQGGLDTSEFDDVSFGQRVAWLDEAVAASGRTDGGPERSVMVFAMARDASADTESPWMETAEAASSPYGLVGSPDAMADALRERRERWGVNYWVCWAEDLALLAPVVDRLAGT